MLWFGTDMLPFAWAEVKPDQDVSCFPHSQRVNCVTSIGPHTVISIFAYYYICLLKNTWVPTTTFKLSEISTFSNGNDLSDKINSFDFLSDVVLNLVSAEWLIDLRGVLFLSDVCKSNVLPLEPHTHIVWCTDHN